MAQSGVTTVQPHLGLPALLSITQSRPHACYTTPSALLPCERLPALGIGPRHHHPGCHSRAHPGPVPPLSIRKTPLIFQDLPSFDVTSFTSLLPGTLRHSLRRSTSRLVVQRPEGFLSHLFSPRDQDPVREGRDRVCFYLCTRVWHVALHMCELKK